MPPKKKVIEQEVKEAVVEVPKEKQKADLIAEKAKLEREIANVNSKLRLINNEEVSELTADMKRVNTSFQGIAKELSPGEILSQSKKINEMAVMIESKKKLYV